MGATTALGTLTSERRADCRYPIQVRLGYRLILGRRICRTETGHLLNISRGGLLFECGHALPEGKQIELDIEWPAQGVRMILHVRGQTVRSQGSSTAVKILRNSFRVDDRDRNDKNRPME